MVPHVHSRTYVGQYAAASGVPGSSLARASLRGTFATIVSPNDPNRYSALPTSNSTVPSSGHRTNVTTAIIAHSTADPRNTA